MLNAEDRKVYLWIQYECYPKMPDLELDAVVDDTGLSLFWWKRVDVFLFVQGWLYYSRHEYSVVVMVVMIENAHVQKDVSVRCPSSASFKHPSHRCGISQTTGPTSPR